MPFYRNRCPAGNCYLLLYSIDCTADDEYCHALHRLIIEGILSGNDRPRLMLHRNCVSCCLRIISEYGILNEGSFIYTLLVLNHRNPKISQDSFSRSQD